jgi:hypothetical protein
MVAGPLPARPIRRFITHEVLIDMARCEVCGNEYDKSFEVTAAGNTHVFDSFECAIHALAPRCSHCECRIIGHGIEADGEFYCCASCASMAGADGAVDRV